MEQSKVDDRVKQRQIMLGQETYHKCQILFSEMGLYSFSAGVRAMLEELVDSADSDKKGDEDE